MQTHQLEVPEQICSRNFIPNKRDVLSYSEHGPCTHSLLLCLPGGSKKYLYCACLSDTNVTRFHLHDRRTLFLQAVNMAEAKQNGCNNGCNNTDAREEENEMCAVTASG